MCIHRRQYLILYDRKETGISSKRPGINLLSKSNRWTDRGGILLCFLAHFHAYLKWDTSETWHWTNLPSEVLKDTPSCTWWAMLGKFQSTLEEKGQKEKTEQNWRGGADFNSFGILTHKMKVLWFCLLISSSLEFDLWENLIWGHWTFDNRMF